MLSRNFATVWLQCSVKYIVFVIIIIIIIIIINPSPVCLFQSLQSKDKQLGVVLVRQRREDNWRELPALEPMHSGCVYGDSFFSCDVRTILLFEQEIFCLSHKAYHCDI